MCYSSWAPYELGYDSLPEITSHYEMVGWKGAYELLIDLVMGPPNNSLHQTTTYYQHSLPGQKSFLGAFLFPVTMSPHHELYSEIMIHGIRCSMNRTQTPSCTYVSSDYGSRNDSLSDPTSPCEFRRYYDIGVSKTCISIFFHPHRVLRLSFISISITNS